MRILIDATTTQDQYATRGIGRFTKQIITGLVNDSLKKNSGDEYILLLFNAPSTLDDLVRNCSNCVRTVNIGALRTSGKFDFIWWRLQYLPGIRRAFKKYDIDLYYSPNFLRGTPPKKYPSISVIYDFAYPVIGRYSMAPWFLDWIRKIQYHYALQSIRRSRGVVAISENTKKDMKKYVPRLGSDRVKVVYLGLPEKHRPKKPSQKILLKYLPQKVIDKGYILYWGGLEVNKNVPNLVRSYIELRAICKKKKIKNIPQLVLAGCDFTRLDMRYPILNEIRDLIRENKIEDDVCFTGYYEDEHQIDLLNGAALFLHLSLYEGFGFSPLEAMKCGVPVVASNRSCYPEVLKDGALLVNPESPAAVAKACLSLLTDQKKAVALSKRGIEVANSYTWERSVKELREYFDENIAGESCDVEETGKSGK